MSIGRICIREVDLAEANESVWQAAERMKQRAVGTLVVVDGGQRPIGIVTDRDLVERVLARRRDPNTTVVAEIMTPDPKTLPEDGAIESALSVMRSGGFRRLPVVDDDDKLVGLLSLDGVLMLLAEEFEQIGALLDRETPRGVAEASV